MTSSANNPYLLLADWLSVEAREIRDIENRADSALHKEGDDSEYRNLMRSKARQLASLDERSRILLQEAGLPGTTAVQERIDRFARSAEQSLEVGSVFFMSALLYPEDHKVGEPNDLENFILELRSLGL